MKLSYRIFLSINLCMLLFFTHTIHSYAAPVSLGSIYITPNTSGYIEYSTNLPEYSCILGGGTTQGANSGTYGYYNDTYVFDYYLTLGSIVYSNNSSFSRYFTPPDNCDSYVVTCSGISGTGTKTSSTITGGSSSTYSGLTVIPTVNVTGLVIDGIEYPYVNNFASPFLNVGFRVGSDALIIHFQITYKVYGYTNFNGVVNASNVPKINVKLYNSKIYWYSGTSSSSSGDISALGDQLTNGYDNTAGNAAADQISLEVYNYLKTEDALYDQMQYEVPEVDIASDGQAIMLASNFLQSLYVSDSFISKCVTFVLTFGLIMYIVGYLKKGT